jgi:aspartyl/asparaginyl-tRNA synthetase
MISYKILDESLTYYQGQGFIRVETPWTVSEYVDNITKPAGVLSFQLKHNNKCLVASGEQSFLYLYLKEFLPRGQYQTITPCFRFESFDFTHTKYFMKNELIKTDIVNNGKLVQITEIALKFYRRYITEAEVVVAKEGFDIIYKDYELGSYGIRECEFLKWIYGTGCAEPRLSNLIKQLHGIS